MLNEAAIIKDLRKTAREITSRKTWSMYDAARLLGYSRKHIDQVIIRAGCFTPRIGGIKRVYGLDLLEIFEHKNELEFPDLAAAWRQTFKIS